jgi:hypothetical protein
LAGTHVRRAPETRGFDSGFDPNMLHDINHDKELTQADVHWRLQRQDLVEAVEHAARAHAKVSGVEQSPYIRGLPSVLKYPITTQLLTNHPHPPHTGSRGFSSRIHPKGVARRLDAPRFAFRRGEFLLIFVQAIRLTACFVYRRARWWLRVSDPPSGRSIGSGDSPGPIYPGGAL